MSEKYKPFHSRKEHDYYKILSILLNKLPKSETRDEIIALTDGYFLNSLQHTRVGDDFDINEAIKISMLTKEDLC